STLSLHDALPIYEVGSPAKSFTADQVQGLVRAGLGDESGAKLIGQRGMDFSPAITRLDNNKQIVSIFSNSAPLSEARRHANVFSKTQSIFKFLASTMEPSSGSMGVKELFY